MLVQRDKSRSDQEHLTYQDRTGSHTSSSQRKAVASQPVPQQPTPQSHRDNSDGSYDVDNCENSGEESIDGLATVSSIDHRGSKFFGQSSFLDY